MLDDDRRSAILAHAALEQGLQCFCIVEAGAAIFASPGFTAAFGVTVPPVRAPWPEFVSGGDLVRLQSALLEVQHGGKAVRLAIAAKRIDAASVGITAAITRIDAYRERPLLFAVLNDEEDEETLAALEHLAFKDPLTGVANHASLLEACRALLERGRHDGRMVGLLLANLDGFRQLNDRCGVAAGDEVLARVARCMEHAVRKGDIVARLGSDEFAVALPRVIGAEDAVLIAGRIIRGVSESGPQALALPVGMSVGVALWPVHGDSIDSLFARAGEALRRAKRSGKNRYCLAGDADDGRDVKAVPFLEWESERDLGISFMDDDHRTIAALINELGDELKSGRDEERLTGCMDRLVSYTATHFAREEQWMDAQGFAGSSRHKAQHTQLLEDVASFALRLDTRSMVVTMRYLQDWLCRHVDETDRELVRAVLAGGKPPSAS